MVSWQIQIDIIECLSEFVWFKLKDKVPHYYAIMADEVIDRSSYKEILLLCLRDVRFCANERNIGKWETFSDSVYIQDYWKEYFAIAFKKWSRRF